MFKRPEEILEADPRFRNMVSGLETDGGPRFWCIEDQRELVADFGLTDRVPEPVRIQFDAARNVFLYAWFDYELHTVAELHSYTVVELALRFRHEVEGPKFSKATGLKKLINSAIERGWLQRSAFLGPPMPGTKEPVCFLNMLVTLRNRLAHGKTHLTPWGSREMIEMCAKTIEALFAEPIREARAH